MGPKSKSSGKKAVATSTKQHNPPHEKKGNHRVLRSSRRSKDNPTTDDCIQEISAPRYHEITLSKGSEIIGPAKMELYSDTPTDESTASARESSEGSIEVPTIFIPKNARLRLAHSIMVSIRDAESEESDTLEDEQRREIDFPDPKFQRFSTDTPEALYQVSQWKEAGKYEFTVDRRLNIESLPFWGQLENLEEFTKESQVFARGDIAEFVCSDEIGGQLVERYYFARIWEIRRYDDENVLFLVAWFTKGQDLSKKMNRLVEDPSQWLQSSRLELINEYALNRLVKEEEHLKSINFDVVSDHKDGSLWARQRFGIDWSSKTMYLPDIPSSPGLQAFDEAERSLWKRRRSVGGNGGHKRKLPDIPTDTARRTKKRKTGNKRQAGKRGAPKDRSSDYEADCSNSDEGDDSK